MSLRRTPFLGLKFDFNVYGVSFLFYVVYSDNCLHCTMVCFMIEKFKRFRLPLQLTETKTLGLFGCFDFIAEKLCHLLFACYLLQFILQFRNTKELNFVNQRTLKFSSALQVRLKLYNNEISLRVVVCGGNRHSVFYPWNWVWLESKVFSLSSLIFALFFLFKFYYIHH